ncbi:unnamed protein product [Chironomus riparius]|uniref:THAP-type domain-containing protein n=1 Tax=Chironomus riparius TaxID=315576 RepID=A0A9N9WTR1_9DIPT|nr:unnamed protein product [Chironomus riparius]
MGGCRCSFYKCSNNTTLAKETNSIHSHFFHFPIKDLQRCRSWAIYSNNMTFLSLPMDKLKNKVICDMHFPESSFMNYTRSKLNKTTAIPSIFINEHRQEVDLLSNPTDWVIENRNAETPSHFKDSNTVKIDIDDSNIDVEMPQPKKIKTEVPKVGEVRILNKLVTSQSNKILTVKQISKPESPSIVKVTPKTLPTSVKVQKTPVKIETSPAFQAKISAEKPKVFKEITPTASAQLSFNDSDPAQETYEFVTVLSSDDQPSFANESTSSHLQGASDEIKSLLSQTSQDILDIKSMLSTSIAKTQTPVKNESSNISQSQFNKVQLFNGIKRYLSPSLIALLRMELFSAPNRKYKKDEKIICSELLKLGDETYDFFNDEWRVRLPAKDEVKSWQNEEMTDDDAC